MFNRIVKILILRTWPARSLTSDLLAWWKTPGRKRYRLVVRCTWRPKWSIACMTAKQTSGQSVWWLTSSSLVTLLSTEKKKVKFSRRSGTSPMIRSVWMATSRRASTSKTSWNDAWIGIQISGNLRRNYSITNGSLRWSLSKTKLMKKS